MNLLRYQKVLQASQTSTHGTTQYTSIRHFDHLKKFQLEHQVNSSAFGANFTEAKRNKLSLSKKAVRNEMKFYYRKKNSTKRNFVSKYSVFRSVKSLLQC